MMNYSTLYQIEREMPKDCDNNWQSLCPSVNASKMSFLHDLEAIFTLAEIVVCWSKKDDSCIIL